jgi:alkylated DNA repair protein (DNA oxidative demethylase)
MDLFENDLFGSLNEQQVHIADGAMLLRNFVQQNKNGLLDEATLLADLNGILENSPLRHMTTPAGFTMSVAMTNCGALGWVSDKKGYRYAALDPITGLPWQPMPNSFMALANAAAAQAGYANFVPDACLINQYQPATRMGLHQDKDEQDFNQPIVSVSLGVPATFLFGGAKRSDKPIKILLQHGDVIVWGGKTRLNYHGVMPLQAANIQTNDHAALGACRINLTFRKAA